MRIVVTVKTGSTKGPAVEPTSDGLLLHVRERPVDGAANAAVIKALAEYYGIAKSSVTIVRGAASRTKYIDIDGR